MSTHADRLAALRDELASRGLQGFVVPLTDEHLSEYVGSYAQRLGWLTGFGGSAGTGVVLPADAAIFTDGRYTIQVREQVDGAHWQYQSVPETSVAAWLEQHAGEGARIGYDPWLHTKGWVGQATAALARAGATLVAVDTNPVDAIWPDRPAPSDARLSVQSDDVAGKGSAAKRAEIADALAARGTDAAVVSALDSIAWLFNLRGGDVEHLPVALAYALIHADGTAELFTDEAKLTDEVRRHLGNGVRVQPRRAFTAALAGLAGKKVSVDPERAVAAIFSALEAAGATVRSERDPSVLPKAIKNPAEQAGARASQARDNAAITRFLHWLSVEAPKGELTEMSAAARLQRFREETGLLKDISFNSISAVGPHAAICHYKGDETSDLPLEPGKIYLIDSGGHYQDGTTDITRTVIVGEPTAEMRDRFTRVLQGHIALATARFPAGTRGSQLDSFARRPLWEAGLDYAHGTGHGVGSYLSVHEGPQRIAPVGSSQSGGDEPLRAGMILSNEPGYYKAGEYGIRIENLVLVETVAVAGAEKEMLGFETLTYAPLDRRLIEPALLTPAERAWVDDYHARTLALIGPQIDGEARAWLAAETTPL
jgi:Xaa-Pro aminopeptidase